VRPVIDHPWDLTPKQAVALQKKLAGRVRLENNHGPLHVVCGLDVSYNRGEDHFFAAAVLLSYPDLDVLEMQGSVARSPFPYIPGLLSFREIPVLAEALARLSQRPDLLACDGQGLAHPRRFGLACHLGVLYDIPAIGLAKSRLIGNHRDPRKTKGSWSWLTDGDDRIGQVVRTRDGVSPLFISPGHRVDFHTARKLALSLCPKWRQPETTRRAHHQVNRLRREYGINND